MESRVLSLLCFLTTFQLWNSLPLEEFYPFGSENGDDRVPSNDDGSSPKITVSTLFPYFNQLFGSVFVNTNGAISFDTTLRTYTPRTFPLSGDRKIVAPYWCDINTRKGGDVWFYETNNFEILSRASREVREVFHDQTHFDAAWVFVATWENVSFFGADSIGQKLRNTFQCILITNGRHSFTIFLFNKIQWTTGTASGGKSSTGLGGTPAQVGFDAGDGFNFKTINQSRTADVINVTLLSNVNIPGKFVYRIDAETVQDGGCTGNTGGTLAIFPRYGSMFGGTELSIGGPCVTQKDNITVEFEGLSEEIQCFMFSRVAIRCVTPLVYETGDIKLSLSIKHENGNDSVFYGMYTFVNPANIQPRIIRASPLIWQVDETVTIRWSKLPFDAASLRVDQFHINNENSLPVLRKEYTIAENVNAAGGEHTFTFNSVGTAALLRIQPNSDTYMYNELRNRPSVWSDVFVVRKSGSQNLRSVCDRWEVVDRTVPTISRQQVEICPCTIDQARLDISRFNPDPFCNSMSSSSAGSEMSINCIYHRDTRNCIRMAFASDTGYDNECCYSQTGSLMITNSQQFGGTAVRYNFKGGTERNVPYLSYIQNDVVPYMYCCQYLSEYQGYDYCEKYLQRRPASHCEGYVPPRPAAGNGDPHLETLDGLDYTFNGVGEFILLQSKDGNLIVQARMDQFTDNKDIKKPASVISSVALQCETGSDIIEVRLNTIRLGDVLLNGELLDFEERNSIEVKGSTIFNSRQNSSLGDLVWTLVSCKRPSVAFNISCVSKMIYINVVIADRNLRGNLKGLLGNYNGRLDDDLTTANGSILPHNSSSEDIHDIFGIGWRTRPSESLFTYPVGRSHGSYQDESFHPVFNVLDNCNADVVSICGNDRACQFDLCTTGDNNFAKSTLAFSEYTEQLANVAIPRCGEPDAIKNGYWIFLNSTVANLKCQTNYKVTGPAQINCQDNGQWAPIFAFCELTTQRTTSNFDKMLLLSIGVPVAAVLVIIIGIFIVIRRRPKRKHIQYEVNEVNVPSHTKEMEIQTVENILYT